jgi:uncharacterized membrane protein YgaE (UPF0421/DUF939 family)
MLIIGGIFGVGITLLFDGSIPHILLMFAIVISVVFTSDF